MRLEEWPAVDVGTETVMTSKGTIDKLSKGNRHVLKREMDRLKELLKELS